LQIAISPLFYRDRQGSKKIKKEKPQHKIQKVDGALKKLFSRSSLTALKRLHKSIRKSKRKGSSSLISSSHFDDFDLGEVFDPEARAFGMGKLSGYTHFFFKGFIVLC